MEITIDTKCSMCDAHKTDLGNLKELEETVMKNFSSWPIDKQAELVLLWFEKDWKKDMALQIQKDKKDNMRSFGK